MAHTADSGHAAALLGGSVVMTGASIFSIASLSTLRPCVRERPLGNAAGAFMRVVCRGRLQPAFHRQVGEGWMTNDPRKFLIAFVVAMAAFSVIAEMGYPAWLYTVYVVNAAYPIMTVDYAQWLGPSFVKDEGPYPPNTHFTVRQVRRRRCVSARRTCINKQPWLGVLRRFFSSKTVWGISPRDPRRQSGRQYHQ